MTVTTQLIHPTAEIDDTAVLGEGVQIESGVIVGPRCVIGANTRLRSRCIIVEGVTMGEGNDVHPFAVLGGDPQDRAFKPEHPGEAIIGDRNVFREHVTISRGTHGGPPTRIGSNCMFMAASHVGHNAQVGNSVVIGNGSLLAGHSSVGDRTVLSGLVSIHQFTMIGQSVMMRGSSGAGMHVPPFLTVAAVNHVIGWNRVGLARHPDITPKDAEEIKRLYRLFYRSRGARSIEAVWKDADGEEWGWAARRFLDFIREGLDAPPPRNRGFVAARATLSHS